jgi:hypothetical protein
VTEQTLEKRICALVKERGGKAFKWVCPGCVGVPDRLCVLPGGRILFAEIKRPGKGGVTSARQHKIIGLLQSLGCEVRRVSDIDEMINWIGGGANEV